MNPIKWVFLAGAIVVSIVPCVLWLFPKLITGDYADIAITNITTTREGHVSVGFSVLVSNKTPVVEGFYDGDKYLGGGGGGDNGSGPFGRPSHGSVGVEFSLNPESTPVQGSAVNSSWFGRLLVQEGQKRHLRAGERMYFYDFRTSDGIRHYGYVEVPNRSFDKLRMTGLLKIMKDIT